MVYLIAFHTDHPTHRDDIAKLIGEFDNQAVSQFCYLVASEKVPSKIFNFFDSIRGEAPFYVFSLSQPFDGEGEMYKEYGKGITGLKDWIAKNME